MAHTDGGVGLAVTFPGLAPVAQLDRAGGFYPSGCGFDSCRGRQISGGCGCDATDGMAREQCNRWNPQALARGDRGDSRVTCIALGEAAL